VLGRRQGLTGVRGRAGGVRTRRPRAGVYVGLLVDQADGLRLGAESPALEIIRKQVAGRPSGRDQPYDADGQDESHEKEGASPIGQPAERQGERGFHVGSFSLTGCPAIRRRLDSGTWSWSTGLMAPHVISTTTNADAERPRISLPRAVPSRRGTLTRASPK